MKEFMETKDDLLRRLKSDAGGGLTQQQAEENIRLYGSNTLTRRKPETVWQRLRSAASEPMVMLLFLAGAVALGVNVFRGLSGGETDYLECAGIFIAICLSVGISVVMEGRSAKAFEALARINGNTAVKAVRGGSSVMLPLEELAAGDIVMLNAGDRVPADGRLLESTGMAADESALTGESHPVDKDADAVFADEGTPLAERSNMVYSGTYITGGYGRMVVTSVGDSTEFGKIAGQLSGTAAVTTPLQEKLARLGKGITAAGVIAAAVVFAVQLMNFADGGKLQADAVMEAFLTSIVLVVAVVPEGLPTIVAVSLSLNIIRLSRQNALVKKMIASETIGCINVICSDKTGTLTENKMAVGAFYDEKWHGKADAAPSAWMAANICVNSTAELGKDGGFIGNPSECAMLRFYENNSGGGSYRSLRDRGEIIQVFPFSSELKHMTTVCRFGGKLTALVKGSPECVLEMCCVAPGKRAEIENCITSAQEKAMRVIAFAHRTLEKAEGLEGEEEHKKLESGMTFDGFVAISDPLRAEVFDAAASCRRAGVDIKILTGDNIVTAKAIAGELQLLDGGGIAVEAREVAAMSDSQLLEKLPYIRVIARSTPDVKLRVVNLLKSSGCVVAVTGDGINDAPALKHADVGIAMGISGTEVSKEASDIVLLDDSFATIVKALEWGRNIYENFKRFICFQLTVNLASVTVVLASVFMGMKAPFTALELLWINIIMDGPPALALGMEPKSEGLMDRKPVGRGENIISRSMLLRIAGAGLFMAAVFLLQYRFNFLQAEPEQMGTVLFTMFVLFQLFNAFNCRELHSRSIFGSLLRNRLMLAVTGATFLLQVFIIQYAGAFFGTVPLPAEMWLKMLAASGSVVLFSEAGRFAWRLLEKD